jgi:uncharacterized protein (DUF2236 family)
MTPASSCTLARMGGDRDHGLFGPDTVIWRVNREGSLLIGGGAAAILQVAHPLVAAGVGEHSRYDVDPWGRLYRTLDITTRITFGPTPVAKKAARAIQMAHKRVHGELPWDAGRFAAGTPYDANDPELQMWVHATLVATSLAVYTRWIGALTIGEQRRYYEEQKTMGEAFGVPRDMQPATLADFFDYYDAMLASDTLASTPVLHDVAASIMRPKLPLAGRPVTDAMNLATAALMTPRWRAELGLAWGPGRERLVDASQAVLRRALPLLPGLMREFPHARNANRRVATAA